MSVVMLVLVSVAFVAVRTVSAQRAAPARTGSITLRDGNGNVVRLPRPARRIVSLIPSATETLIALGMIDHIVGRTNYDKAPVVAKIPSVGGGLDPNLETLLSLRPDLVINWSAENRRQVGDKLRAAGIPVFNLRTQDTTDILSGIVSIGRMTGRDSAALALVGNIRAEFQRMVASTGKRRQPSVLYVVSTEPAITAGPKTFITQVIGIAGGKPVFPDLPQNWPRVSVEEIARRNPDYIVLPVGEFRANALSRLKSAPGWRDLAAVRGGRVVAIEADLINRPSPSIVKVARRVHAELFPPVSR
jgi:iron complex transport system substrate-binding protein